MTAIDTEPSSASVRDPGLIQATICCLGLLAWIMVGIFILQAGLHGILMLGLVWVALHALALGARYDSIRTAMGMGMNRAMPALFIFLLIGVVIVTFIASGTVATLIYYGLLFLHPMIFLPAGLVLCSLMSLATGTSWGTVGTGGIVLISIGGALGIPLPLVAGMIISGASFGDKMSPVSDTTNLAAMSADTNLYAHIRSMLYTTGPSYVIALILFTVIGYGYADQTLPEAELRTLLAGLDATYEINILMLLPMVVLMGLAMWGLAAEAAMMIAALVAMLMAILIQGHAPGQMLTAIYDGAVTSTGVDTLDSLLNRGGISAMAWTFTLAVIAIVLGALLEAFGFLKVLISGVFARLRRQAAIVTASIFTGLGGNLALGEAYISIILGGQLCRDAYDEAGIDRAVLSRSLEEGSTLTTALIPWTTAGAFYTATLGVATIEYLPWAFLNWINPLMGIGFAWLGIALIQRRPVPQTIAASRP
ncbi:MAG: Na+/H+ antiporter NhaC [Proteobacteria bacterium]|jgi:NhaC family Na+:H+ antiporter|nr:Na+/H+ antiporter NhaC [Pseudomonadota bacterium]